MSTSMTDTYLHCHTCHNSFLYTVEERRKRGAAGLAPPSQCPGCLALNALTSRHMGTLERYNRRRGYGFIRDDDGDSVFVHASALGVKRGSFIEPGTRLSYCVERDERGPRAVAVRINS